MPFDPFAGGLATKDKSAARTAPAVLAGESASLPATPTADFDPFSDGLARKDFDPFASGLATEDFDPFKSGLAKADAPGTLEGAAGSFRRGVRQVGQNIDAATLVVAAGNAADADLEPERVARERAADRAPNPKNFEAGGPGIGGQRGYEISLQKWQTRETEREERLRNNARYTEQVRKEVLPAFVGAIERRQEEIDAIPQTAGKTAYDKAESFGGKLKVTLRHPIDVVAGLSAQSLPASASALALGAVGSVAGPGGTAAGAGLGSFAMEAGATILKEIARTPGVDMRKPETVAAALADPERLQEIRTKAAQRGVGVGVFDALSAGIAGRLMRTAAKTRLGSVGHAAAEMGVQGALGGAGEVAGSVASGDQIDWGDVLSEVLGEAGGGTVEIATGAIRDRASTTTENNLRGPGSDKPATPPAPGKPPTATTGAPASASTSATSDLESAIGASLPDNESRDVLRGRRAEATGRALKEVKVDFGQTVESVKDALLARDATPAQLDALDFQLRVLEERKGKRRLTADQVNASLGATFLMDAMPAAEIFPLVSRLADDAVNIAALRAGIASMRTGGPGAGAAPAPAGQNVASMAPAAGPALTPEQRAAKAAELQSRELAAVADKQKAEAESEQQRVAAGHVEKDKTQRARSENERIAAIEATGRDQDTKQIVDLTKVPDDQIDTLDAAAEGITEQQLDAEMQRRARVAERAEAAAANRGEELLAVLRAVKLPSSDKTLPGELSQIIRGHMTARQRMEMLSGKPGSLDNVAEALREKGFGWAQTPADVIDAVQRALGGEKIYAERGGDIDREGVQFARRGGHFVEQLGQWIAGKLDRQVVLTVGAPSSALQSAGFPVQPITVTQSVLTKATKQHGVDAHALGGLPDAIQSPIMVFDSATRPNSRVVLTEIETGGNKTVVAVQLDAAHDGEQVSDIRSIFPRDVTGLLLWIDQGLVRWHDPQKSQAWLRLTAPYNSARVLSQLGNGKQTSNEEGVKFSRRTGDATTDRTRLARLAEQWWDNFRLIAPGVARQVELRFSSPEALMEEGLESADELTGKEEAAYVRRRTGAVRRIIYLFERALAKNMDDVTRLNLQHEMGHAFWATLTDSTRDNLEAQWKQEMKTKTGPLFGVDGNLRPNVARRVESDVQEWFAERLAHANDDWAKRRMGARAKGDTVIHQLAANFRALLTKLLEYIERGMGRAGYDDALVRDFRTFLDQGDRWSEPAVDEDLRLAGSFAREGLPYARRGDKTQPLQLTAEQAARALTIVSAPAKPLGSEGSLKEAKERALESLRQWYGRPIVNGDDGSSIVITRNAVQHGMHNEGAQHVQMVPSLPELLRTGVRLASEMHHPPEPTVRAVHRYAAALQLGDQLYRVKLTVKELINGTNLYDHAATEIESPGGTGTPRRSSEKPLGDGPAPGDSITIGELFGGVKDEHVRFARRETGEEGRTPEQLLRDYASLERTRDRYLDEGERVPRYINTGLADLRIALEESLPGWRDRLPKPDVTSLGTPVPTLKSNTEQASNPTSAQPTTARQEAFGGRSSRPEPEQGVGALFEEAPDEIAPEATADKFSQLSGSTLRRPVGLVLWLNTVRTFFTNFKSAIPELPGGAAGRQFMTFREGYSMMKSATATVRKEAEEMVEHVMSPLMNIGRAAVEPQRYRELQELQEVRQKQIAAGQPIGPALKDRIGELQRELAEVPYHIFREIVMLRDLYFRSKLKAPNGDPLALPFGLTAPEVEAELKNKHEALARNPHREQIEESLRRHYVLVKRTRDELLARGYIIPEELRNPLYYPHIVLEKATGKAARVTADSAEDFRSYLQPLLGSTKGIEADYLQAMYGHMSQVIAHNRHEDLVEQYWHKPYDIKERVQKEVAEENARRRAEGLGPVSLQQRIPDGYREVVVDKRIPLRPGYLIDRGLLAKRLGVALGDGDLQQQLRELGLTVTITAEDLRSALIAAEKVTWIVPEAIAKAMDAIVARDNLTAGVVERIVTKPNSAWKYWTLFAPQAVTRYTWGNVVADVEKLFSADPAVFKKLLPALREVRAFYKGAKPSADLKEALRRGVLDAVTASEVAELPEVAYQHFAAMLTSRQVLLVKLRKYVQLGRSFNVVREATFRYAKFQADLERMRAGAEPIYAGAYNRDVRALEEDTPEGTRYARAAIISRKTFGDYNDISVSGAALREYLIPFYSWMEINFRYHANLFRNLKDMSAGAAAAQIARGTGAAASRVIVPRSVSGVLLRLALPHVALAFWNAGMGSYFASLIGLKWDEDEDLETTLTPEDRRRAHLILGKDSKGKTVVVMTPTALSDVMRWFGGNDFTKLAGEYLRGDLTLGQLAHEWVSNLPGDTLNNVFQSVGPIVKAPLTAISRRNFFPNVLDPRALADHDLWWNVLGQMTDGFTADVVRRVADKDYYSSKDFGDWSQQLILQARRRDPEQWGYYATLDRVEAYKAAHAGAVEPGVNNREDAKLLANFRKTIRAGDIPAALAFYQKLLDAGYTAERFQESVDRNDPLAPLKREVRQQFADSLSPAEREDLKNGYQFAARMKAFDNRERELFPVQKGSPEYKAAFAAQGGRPDVFAEIMEETSAEGDDVREMRVEELMRLSLLPHTPRARRR